MGPNFDLFLTCAFTYENFFDLKLPADIGHFGFQKYFIPRGGS